MRALGAVVLPCLVLASSAWAQADAGVSLADPQATGAAVTAVAQGVSAAAATLGVEVSPGVVNAYATFLVDGLTAKKLKDAQAAGATAAASVSNADDAERYWLGSDAPERPGVSVHLRTGAPTPFDAVALSPAEDVRRTQAAVDSAVTLRTENTGGVMLPTPVFWTVLGVATAALAAGIAAEQCADHNCLNRPAR